MTSSLHESALALANFIAMTTNAFDFDSLHTAYGRKQLAVLGLDENLRLANVWVNGEARAVKVSLSEASQCWLSTENVVAVPVRSAGLLDYKQARLVISADGYKVKTSVEPSVPSDSKAPINSTRYVPGIDWLDYDNVRQVVTAADCYIRPYATSKVLPLVPLSVNPVRYRATTLPVIGIRDAQYVSSDGRRKFDTYEAITGSFERRDGMWLLVHEGHVCYEWRGFIEEKLFGLIKEGGIVFCTDSKTVSSSMPMRVERIQHLARGSYAVCTTLPPKGRNNHSEQHIIPVIHLIPFSQG